MSFVLPDLRVSSRAWVLALLVLGLVGCGRQTQQPIEFVVTPEPSESPELTSVPPTPAPETITLTISLYRLVSAGSGESQPNASLSSARTDAELRDILDGMNDIWSQANIQFEARYIGPVDVPDEVLLAMAAGDFGPFFGEANLTAEPPDPGIINGIYARDIGGPNGISPRGSRLFFVTDQPSVHDERVSSHEVGHILGLHHVFADADHLLSPGTNGTLLEDEEIIVARYVARGILSNAR